MRLLALILSSIYAAWLSTPEGKRWVDENTTTAVVLGVGGVLALLRGVVDRETWFRVFGLFAAAGAPLVVRGVLRKVGG